jgi:hypothetical protein
VNKVSRKSTQIKTANLRQSAQNIISANQRRKSAQIRKKLNPRKSVKSVSLVLSLPKYPRSIKNKNKNACCIFTKY